MNILSNTFALATLAATLLGAPQASAGSLVENACSSDGSCGTLTPPSSGTDGIELEAIGSCDDAAGRGQSPRILSSGSLTSGSSSDASEADLPFLVRPPEDIDSCMAIAPDSDAVIVVVPGPVDDGERS
jgi:hypothetical protein